MSSVDIPTIFYLYLSIFFFVFLRAYQYSSKFKKFKFIQEIYISVRDMSIGLSEFFISVGKSTLKIPVKQIS